MLAAVKTEKQNEIIVKEKQIPSLLDGEVLIKVNYCGVCGSDLHAFTHSKGYEFVAPPIILGHEISGIVVESSNVNDLVGKNVIVESMHYCNECDNCRAGRYSICDKNQVIGLHFDGGMAQYVKTNEKYIREIPIDLDLNAAALSEPMAIAVHAVKKAGGITKNDVVLVQGPGIIGLFVGLICLSKGAKVIISGLQKDYEKRLAIAEKFGMESYIVDGDILLEEKVDIIFECSGSTIAVQDGLKHLKKGGKSVIVALYEQTINLFLTDFVRNEWPIITSYGCDPIDYEEAFDVIKFHQKKILSTIDQYSINQVEKAFLDSLNKTVLKAVIKLGENA